MATRQFLAREATVYSEDSAATPSTLLQRDASGNGILNQLTLTKLAGTWVEFNANKRTVTGTDSALITDKFIICNGASFVLTLPAVADASGMTLEIFNKHATGVVTVEGAGAETINGAANFTLATQYSKCRLYCDGTEWWRTV